MEVYATIADIESRWRPIEQSEMAVVTTRLSDASAQIRLALLDAGIDIDVEDEEAARIRTMVVCSMVRRASENDAMDVSAQTQTAGPYSITNTFANPSGVMAPTKKELKMLGIGRTHACVASPYGGD